MTDQPGGTKDQITSFQCCMFRTSRFSSALPCPRLPRPEIGAAPPEEPAPPPEEAPGGPAPRPVSHAFQRLRGAGSAAPSQTAMAQAAIAVAVVAWLLRAGRRVVRR